MIGSTSGVGKELANNLYAHNAKVYLAARSASKADETIRPLKSNFPNSKGVAVFLKLDLNDLNTIKVSAEEFLNKEQRTKTGRALEQCDPTTGQPDEAKV